MGLLVRLVPCNTFNQLKAAPMPTNAIVHPSNPAPKPSNGEMALQTPTPRQRKGTRTPLTSWPEFKRVLINNDRRLRDYQHHGRRDRVLLHRSELDQLDPAAAHLLHATNARARIKYTRIARRKLLAQLGERGTREPVAFVTLVNQRYTLPVAEAGTIDLVSLKAWVRAEMPGCSFVGVAEAALYGNVGLAGESAARAVCWHAHLLVWGVGRAQLAELIKSVSRRNLTLVPGAAAGHSRLLRPDKIEAQIIYMFKGAVSEYRIWQHREDVADKFGELRREGTGKFYQRKQPLRLGDLARMTRVLSDQYLDGLTFAAGEGKPILKAINEAALAPYRRWLDVAERQRALRANMLAGRARAAALASRSRRDGA